MMSSIMEIEIKYIGLRAGEKLYEELITEGEDVMPTECDDIMVLQPSIWHRGPPEESFCGAAL